MSEAELVARIDRLERDNRKLKRTVLAALVLVAIAMGLGAAYATPAIPQKIAAHEFDVVDAAGNLRENLAIENGQPVANFFGSQGTNEMRMSLTPNGPIIELRTGKSSAALGVFHGTPNITLTGPNGKTRMWMMVDDGEPEIHLGDARGYSMDLGSTQTVAFRTGETIETPAASIVMFGNGKKHPVIWQAPQ